MIIKVEALDSGTWHANWSGVRPVIYNCNSSDVTDDGKTYYQHAGLTYIISGDTASGVAAKKSIIEANILDSISLVDNSYTVTSIGDEAFNKCTSLKVVNIPDTIISIGVSAFSYCSSLESVVIPNSVTTFVESENGASTFYDCTSLIDVTFHDNLENLEDNAFANCYSLESINIPSSVTSIDKTAFSECQSLSSIDIPNIGILNSFLYSGCYNLTSVIVPDSVKKINYGVFQNNVNLTDIILLAGLTAINKGAFVGTNSVSIFTYAMGVQPVWVTGWNNNRPVYYAGTWYINAFGIPTPNPVL